jgi:inner membrane protein
MEPTTHFLFGACLSRAGLNRTTGLATLTMVLASEAPDIDILAYLKGSVFGMAHHRGFTHTLMGVPFVAGLTIVIVYGVHRAMLSRARLPVLPPRWGRLYLYAMFACLLHIFLDFMNNYGVRPFAPFHPKWYSWDILFILDPVILALLFLGLVIPSLLGLIGDEVGSGKTTDFRGRGAAIFALVCMAAWIGVRDFEHRRAVIALNSLTYADEEPLRASAYPSPVNPFVWNGVVETQNFFERTSVNSNAGEVDPQRTAVIRYKPQESPVTLAAKRSYLGRIYLDWAQYPVTDVDVLPDQKNYIVRFTDLRFAYISDRRKESTLGGYVILDHNLHVVSEGMGHVDIAQD